MSKCSDMSLILTLRIDMEPTEKDSRSFVDSNIEFRPAYNTDFLNEPDDDDVNNTSFVNNDGSMIFALSEPSDSIIVDYPAEARREILSVFDVACYVMSKVKQCTTMKLQKLLYYCQAWYLVWNDKPLFRENIEAWANGPVIRELYNFHKGLFTITENMMSLGNPNLLSIEQKTDIDNILNAYADKTSQWLIDQTHSECPWQEARRGMSPNERGHKVITHAAMAEYYSSLYEQEV